jgi:hypothetical protein
MADWSLGPSGAPMPTGFFAYAASPPAIPETVKAAIEAISKTQKARLASWEDLRVGGKYIISEICGAIADADFFCADITTINANVMFEIGFAIARNKRIWLIRDDSYSDTRKEFDQLRLLTTVGYSPYVNSEQIIKAFFKESPHETLGETIFKQSIEPTLAPPTPANGLLYLKSRHDTEASVRVSRVLQDSDLPIIVDDPRETSVQPLYWYAQKLLETLGVVVHFLSVVREGFRLHNARYALVSGLARGFELPVLMLTEQSDFLSPMDYRDSMQYYTTPSEAAKNTDEWVQPIALKARPSTSTPKRSYLRAVKLATALRDFHLTLGEYVAENEAEHLPDYFVETTAHLDVVNGTQTIFVGRKGTGKTSNLIQAAHEVGRDTRNLVCIIKPFGYEIEGMVRLFMTYKFQDLKGYVIESLWKYMLYTEIARAAAGQIEGSALWQLGDPHVGKLVSLLEEENSSLSGDFTVRLERVVASLKAIKPDSSAEAFHKGVSEALHSGAIGRLRSVLAEIVSLKRRVIVLVDNLDKPWGRNADLDQLAEFLLGLLTAAQRVSDELRKSVAQREYTKFNIAVFLRSDIFKRVMEVAREPDKLSHTRLSWDDPELLLRVIEERYVSAHGTGSDPSTMWHNYFCAEVRGIPTRDYLVGRILPRPRDIVYFVKAAVSMAVNRKHDRVEEKDILDGEKVYSQYALDSVLVENGVTIPQLQAVLYEFVGDKSILSETSVLLKVTDACIAPEKAADVINHLVSLTFLGLETSEGHFSYSDEAKELMKHSILADRIVKLRGGEKRYEVNSAFRAYLEISEPELQ